MHSFPPLVCSALLAGPASKKDSKRAGGLDRPGEAQPPLRCVGSGHRNAGRKIHTPIKMLDSRFSIS